VHCANEATASARASRDAGPRAQPADRRSAVWPSAVVPTWWTSGCGTPAQARGSRKQGVPV